VHGWPVVLRPTGVDERVRLVHAAGGPLGGDDLALSVDVGPGARLAVHSAGATLVQPGAATDAPARWPVELRVGTGARVHRALVSDGAGMESTVRIVLAADAVVTLREIVVLGRHGQRGGRYAGTTHVAVDGALLAHTTLLDGADPGLCGPAGTGGARAVGTLVRAGAAVAATLSGRRGDPRCPLGVVGARRPRGGAAGGRDALRGGGRARRQGPRCDRCRGRVPRGGRSRAGHAGPGAG
jgi:urease accessory protein